MTSPDRLWTLLWRAATAGTLGLVVAMALLSAFAAHPDEKDHVGAGEYYMRYWDPPAVGDERARGAYSNYGVSYLNQLDAVYFFAGKFAVLARPLVGQDHVALRLFNVLLFALLTAMAWSVPGRWRLALLPLYLTPQAWYVFSYFNGDALPLALSMGAVWLCAVRLASGSESVGRGWVWGMGLLLGLLTVSKQNYYVYLVFFVAFWTMAAGARRGLPGVGGREAWLALGLAALIFGARYGAHLMVAAAQPPDAQHRLAEQMAAPEFKPSAQVDGKGFWGSRMRSKGVTLAEMFTGEWKWHVFTFRSAFGKYGAMDVEAPLLFYRWIGRAAAVFGLAYAAALLRAGMWARGAFALWFAFALLTVGQSLWHSWNNDFQSQGRYLFPILPMTGCVLALLGPELGRGRAWLWGLGAILWVMSAWSFTAVGLARIPC
ncbi:hypothetical protein NNJEOMEG_01099 [Fundidesulfovibrio magnetotacticus]|uniref:Glycosyltransferase RgtA/B/C/D-like domain-containing protein n=1 Tax=Fundidesulfovibrio magnetotacticus TaxID=2730080 RepID=A0A6V8LSI4_9BACT|nr:DUF2142 domain-containing protein [Fundidesulfovibrio magnetotacticus]GFK93268.1 hypothetical protein NNJEOMEG_01099 [Fundidesulfovibrio magnetotacticus]